MSYKIIRTVKNADVPDWERRRPKWTELTEAVMELEPGRSLEIAFDNVKAAKRAGNAVRDQANVRENVVRTRLIKNEDGSAILYLSKVLPDDASA